MKKLMMILTVLMLTSSCAMHKGYMQNSTSLSSNNFSYAKRNIKSSAKTMLVFGIGGFIKQSLIAEAKRNMLQDNPLQDNQTLANITVSEKTSIFIVIVIQEITVTADIVQFK